jgi:chromate transport protein ChrA
MSYFKLFFTFLKTGTISFGGYMMLISMIQREFSENNKVLKKKKDIRCNNYGKLSTWTNGN